MCVCVCVRARICQEGGRRIGQVSLSFLALQVKDRFCSLLSQQVAELQHKLSSAPKESIDMGDFPSVKSEPSGGAPVQEVSVA